MTDDAPDRYDGDDFPTSPGLSADVRRQRRVSTATIDSAELLLAELRSVPTVFIPDHGRHAMHAHGLIRDLVKRIYDQGKASAEVALAEARTENERLRYRARYAEAWTAELKAKAYDVASGKAEPKSLIKLLTRPSTIPPKVDP